MGVREGGGIKDEHTGQGHPPPMAARRTESLAFICLRVISGSGSLCASSAAPKRSNRQMLLASVPCPCP